MLTDPAKTFRTSFLRAARYQGPVKGCTHNLYKYPARFSPVFARAAIESFTSPGDIILDPFVGGGTTIIEARLAGRHAFGSDISSLAIFLARTKSIPLSHADLDTVEIWFGSILPRLTIRRSTKDHRNGLFEGYGRNMPWRLRKLCEQYLACIQRLPSARLQRFARCVFLRCGQWAMDCRKTVPSVAEFRDMLADTMTQSVASMREYRLALAQTHKNLGRPTLFRCVQCSAADLSAKSFGGVFRGKANLILTSPPYPGIHVLYHRWSVRGRRETPAPFWIADCLDGDGSVHYTLGERRQKELKDYFSAVTIAFSNLRHLLTDEGLVVQLLAFSSPDWQLDAYLSTMETAGYREVLPKEIDVDCSERLWRPIPGRRWYSMMRADISSGKEVILFHRKT